MVLANGHAVSDDHVEDRIAEIFESLIRIDPRVSTARWMCESFEQKRSVVEIVSEKGLYLVCKSEIEVFLLFDGYDAAWIGWYSREKDVDALPGGTDVRTHPRGTDQRLYDVGERLARDLAIFSTVRITGNAQSWYGIGSEMM